MEDYAGPNNDFFASSHSLLETTAPAMLQGGMHRSMLMDPMDHVTPPHWPPRRHNPLPSTMGVDGRPTGYRISFPSVPAFSMLPRRAPLSCQTGKAMPTVTPGPAAFERGSMEGGARATLRCEPAYSMGRRLDPLRYVPDPVGLRSSYSSLTGGGPGPGEHQRLERPRALAFTLNPRREAMSWQTGKALPTVTPGPAACGRGGMEGGVRATLKREPAHTMGRRFELSPVPDRTGRNSWSSVDRSAPGPGSYDMLKY